jgi:phosphate transport system substrate-binding protein
MKIVTVCLALLAVAALQGAAGATSDKALLYGGAGQGKVIFDGRLHASKGLACMDCHSAIFATKKEALITMANHGEKVACFVCHDGKKVFNDCDLCHRKF